MDKPETSVGQLAPRKRWMGAAVICIVFLVIAGIMYAFFHPGKPVILALRTSGRVSTDTLTDGSVITLNQHSTVYYPNKFQGKERRVELHAGEAFFNIAPDKDNPFLVSVNNVLIMVAGDVNIRTAGNSIEVIAENGMAKLTRNGEVIKIKTGEKVNINCTTGELKKERNTDILYKYYRTHLFILNNTPLWRITDVLNQAYHLNMVIADDCLANQPITTTFKVGHINQTLYVICQTLRVHAVKQGDKIMIR